MNIILQTCTKYTILLYHYRRYFLSRSLYKIDGTIVFDAKNYKKYTKIIEQYELHENRIVVNERALYYDDYSNIGD